MLLNNKDMIKLYNFLETISYNMDRTKYCQEN